jgi:hypothetical protein
MGMAMERAYIDWLDQCEVVVRDMDEDADE